MLNLLTIGIFGALIGSFANVVIYRLPKKESIVFPGSHCPNCNHKIKPWENIPVLSWLFLRGKCSNCKVAISWRYPLIESLMALGFVLLALRWPLEQFAFTLLPLLIIFSMLLMMSLIDIDHFILPDSLTLPALALALLAPLIYVSGSGLPNLSEAFIGAMIAAGIIVLINRVGSLVLRRFKDTKERLWPISMDQVNVAALFGLGGWLWGVGAACVSLLLNLFSRKTLRLPEPILYGLWLVGLVAFSFVMPLEQVAGTLIASGIVAIVGAVFWWLKDMFSQEPEEIEDDEPIAMGFGDVKLAAILGALLGWQALLVALFLSFLLGAIGGIAARLAGGDRLIPFGPYLALGGLLALFFGSDILTWYIGLLGFEG